MTNFNKNQEKFDVFVKDDRFKRLEKVLSKFDTNHGQIYCSSSNWSCLSTIHGDSADTTGQVSKAGSTIVSSSSNLKKILPITTRGNFPMATSSVKNFSTNNCLKDSVIMPPPPVPIHQGKKIIDNKQNDNGLNLESEARDFESVSVCQHFSKNCPSPVKSSSRIFYKWRVALDSQGQLIIKGISPEWYRYIFIYYY